jgi:hypothetical protein
LSKQFTATANESPRRSKKSMAAKEFSSRRVSAMTTAPRAPRQFVPQEPESVLAGRTEQVQHQVLVDGDATEVQRHGGGGLALHARQIVDAGGQFGDQFLGAQRSDLADRGHHGGLPDAETAGYEDFDRGSQVGRGRNIRHGVLQLSDSIEYCSQNVQFAGPAGIGVGPGGGPEIQQTLADEITDEDLGHRQR